MHVSPKGRAALEAREGRRLVAYQDSTGVWTIGVGHTGRTAPPHVRAGMRITEAQCNAYLAADLAPVEAAINGLGLHLTQNQFDACASLAFNIGAHGFVGSSVVRQLKSGNVRAAADDFLMWERPPELKKRREGERAQFLTPDAPTANAGAERAPAAKSAHVDKPVAPAAAAPASPPAATKAPSMNIASILADLFGGVTGKLSAASTVASVAPAVVSGTIKNLGEIPKAISDVNALAADVKGGKWSNLEQDASAALGEFGTIVSNFGINLGALNALPQQMAHPAVTAGATISDAAS